MAMLCIPGRVNWKPEIEGQRPNRQIEANPDSEVRTEAVESPARTDDRNAIRAHWRTIGDRSRNRVISTRHRKCLGSKIPGIRIDEAAVVKKGPAPFFDDRKTYFYRCAGRGRATNRLAKRIFRTDIAKPEAAEVIRTAEIQTIVDRHGWKLLRERHRRTTGDRHAFGVGYEAARLEQFCLGPTPNVHSCGLNIRQNDYVFPHPDVFGRSDIHSVNLLISTEWASGNKGRNRNSLALASQKWTVAPVPNQTGAHHAFCRRSCFSPNFRRDAGGDVVDIVVLQTVTEHAVDPGDDRLSRLQ